MRQEEHAEYLKASKDFKDSAAAVAKAIDVLNEYYSSASFVQAMRAIFQYTRNRVSAAKMMGFRTS